jgi:hypothetical protein
MSKVFGRDKVVKLIWGRLEEKSIVFVAERRVGKTTVLDEIKYKYDDNCIVIYSDLEKIGSPIELVENILNSTYEYQNKRGKAFKLFEDFRGFLLSVEQVGKIKFSKERERDWKTLLIKAIHSICEQSEERVVFLWDEIPYMLQKIHSKEKQKNSSENSAIEILDTLRALMNEIDNLRFVYTGSIGLHHVISEIAGNLTSQPTNDMDIMELKPLNEQYAREMTEFYLKKELVEYSDKAIIEIIYTECDRVPFYIEKVVKKISLIEDEVSADIVKEEISKMIIDANNELEMEHFRERLSKYYTGSVKDVNGNKIKKSSIAKALLNFLAISNSSHSIDDCHTYLKSVYSLEDRDLTIKLLDFLAKDYYIAKDLDNKYSFCFTLIKRWWIMAEGLDSIGDNS